MNVPKFRTFYDRTSKALSPTLLTWVTFLELDGCKTKVCAISTVREIVPNTGA